MRIRASLICATLMILFFVTPVLACLERPHVVVGDTEIGFRDIDNESIVVQTLMMKNFTAKDVEVIKNFILNGYVVTKQSDTEYASFMENATNTNLEWLKAGCGLNYVAVARNGTWTGYIMNFSATPGFQGPYICAQQSKCAITFLPVHVLWNDLPPPTALQWSDAVQKYWWLGLFIIVVLLAIVFLRNHLRPSLARPIFTHPILAATTLYSSYRVKE